MHSIELSQSCSGSVFIWFCLDSVFTWFVWFDFGKKNKNRSILNPIAWLYKQMDRRRLLIQNSDVPASWAGLGCIWTQPAETSTHPRNGSYQRGTPFFLMSPAFLLKREIFLASTLIIQNYPHFISLPHFISSLLTSVPSLLHFSKFRTGKIKSSLTKKSNSTLTLTLLFIRPNPPWANEKTLTLDQAKSP